MAVLHWHTTLVSCWARAQCGPHAETAAADNLDYRKRIEVETIVENMCKHFLGPLCEASNWRVLG